MNLFATLVFAPFSIFITQPLLALLPAALFAILYRESGRRVAAGAGVLWFLYTVYEYGMHRRWLCSGECNIRIDLLLLYPVLWIVSITAVIVAIVTLRRRRTPEPVVDVEP